MNDLQSRDSVNYTKIENPKFSTLCACIYFFIQEVISVHKYLLSMIFLVDFFHYKYFRPKCFYGYTKIQTY